MARLENPAAGTPLSLGQAAGWDKAAHLAARAGTFLARALVFAGVAIVGAVLVPFGLLLATVAAPLFAAAVVIGIARVRRARGLRLQPT